MFVPQASGSYGITLGSSSAVLHQFQVSLPGSGHLQQRKRMKPRDGSSITGLRGVGLEDQPY